MTLITIAAVIAIAAFWRDLHRQTKRVAELEREVHDLKTKPRVSIARNSAV